MAGFSLPLPAQVICEMLGVPAADIEQFHAWSDAVMGDWQRDGDEIMTALAELYGYFGTLIEIKRAQPADDMMSALIAARDDADRLSEEELTVMCCTLLIGGHETTANQINLSLLLLLDHPGEAAKLRDDPGLIPGAVEELLRYVRLGGLAPARVTTEDVQIGGVGSRRVSRSYRCSRQPTGTLRYSAIRTGSTSAATQPATWPSAQACITASAPSLPG